MSKATQGSGSRLSDVETAILLGIYRDLAEWSAWERPAPGNGWSAQHIGYGACRHNDALEGISHSKAGDWLPDTFERDGSVSRVTQRSTLDCDSNEFPA